MRILGLDVGERRIGVAICDAEERLATPLCTIQRQGDAVAVVAIADLVSGQMIGAIVVGMPISMDGSWGRQAQQVGAFADALALRVDVPVTNWDERLSTVEAERRLREAGHSSRTMKSRRDAVAAAIILQSYLDRRRTTDVS